MQGQGGSGESDKTPAGNDGAAGFGEHREVTALFYDLVESTRLLMQSDLEDYQEVIAAFQERTGHAVRAQGGVIADRLGDGGMVYFGYPTASEDAAAAAISAGLGIVRACRQLAVETGRDDLHVRVAIATSHAVIQATHAGVGAGVTGVAPVLASRLQGFAAPDTVVVSERTRLLAQGNFQFEFLGTKELKGFERPEKAWTVSRPIVGANRFKSSSRLNTQMVGREDELASALDVWRKAMAGQGQGLLIVGEAGIGKSRLIYELLRQTGRLHKRIIALQCAQRATQTPFSPIVELVTAAISSSDREGVPTLQNVDAVLRREGIRDEKAIAAIAFIAGADMPHEAFGSLTDPGKMREHIFWAVHRCLEQWGGALPIVIVIEDIHWADPSTSDLIHDLLKWISGKPICLTLTSRDQAPWSDEGIVTQIDLRQLSQHTVKTLVSSLITSEGKQALSESILEQIYQRTDGVPLYLEELSQWLEDMPEKDRDAWLGGQSSARILSLENILSSRLAKLGNSKQIAQAAAVVGRSCDERLLRTIVPATSHDSLSEAIEKLIKANIFVPDATAASPAYEFRHSLYQETLYGSLTRRPRMELHRKIYDAAMAGVVQMRSAALGRHAELDSLPVAAIAHYIEAAKESFARSAVVEARQLLERSLGIVSNLPRDDETERLELSALAALGPILTSTLGTKAPEACALYDRAVKLAGSRPADEQAQWFPIYWGWWYTGADFGIQRKRAEAVMTALRHVQDPEVQLQVQHCVWAIDFNMGRHDTCVAAVNTGLELYQLGIGERGLTLYGGHDPRVCGLGQRGLSLWFKGYPKQALKSVTQALEYAEKTRHVGTLTHALDIAAMLHRYRHDFETLRHVTIEMRKHAEEHRLPMFEAKAMIFDGWRLALSGEPARGREMADKGFEIERQIGTREDFPVYADMLAQILELLGQPERAIELVAEAIDEAERTDHLYWLPELYRRQALLAHKLDLPDAEIVEAINLSISLACEQNAQMLLMMAYETALDLGLIGVVDPTPGSAIEAALEKIGANEELAHLYQKVERKRVALRQTLS